MMVLNTFRKPFRDAFAYWRKLIFREEFSLDSFYEEVTDEKWKILTTRTSTSRELKKSNTEVVNPVEEMLLMQTNVLSHIPECFGLSTSDGPTKHRDKFKTSRPPKTPVHVRKRPTNEPLVRAKSEEDRIRQLREKNKSLKRRSQSVDESQPRRAPQPLVRFAERAENSSTLEEENPSYTYQKTKSKIRLKTKTKIKRSKWNTKSAPVLRRMNNVEEEMTSCTEFSQETNISFAAYVKKRTPNFNFKKTKSKSKGQKLKRTEGNGNINLLGFSGRDDNLQLASERNVTFNPIFQEDDSEKRRMMYQLSRDDQSLDDHEHDDNFMHDYHVDKELTTRDSSRKMYQLSRDEQSSSDHVHGQSDTRDYHVKKQLSEEDSSRKSNTQTLDNHDNTIVQPRSVHVRMSDKIQSNRFDNHVEATCSDKNVSNRLENNVEDDVPVTCIDGPFVEEYNDYDDHVPVSSIDQSSHEENDNDHVPRSSIDQSSHEENDNDHVPISSIDQSSHKENDNDHVPVTCIDDVGDQSDHEDSHVRRPTLIRAGRIHDLDMCGWYDDDNRIDYNKLFYDDDYTNENDDDDFTTRMLKQTAAILTFDMTTRRRELYTIDEEPED